MKYCHQCGNRLVLGTEIYCPACGTKQLSVSEISSATNTATTITEISRTSGDVIGSTTSGTGNIIGKEVAYSVSGNVFYIHVNSISAQTLQELKNMASQSVQLETKEFHGEKLLNISTEIINEKANEARTSKEQAKQVLKDIDKITKGENIKIDQIRIGEVQVSRTELRLKDIISEGNEYYYKGVYLKAVKYFDKALKIDGKFALAWFNKGFSLSKLGKYDEAIICYDTALKIGIKHATIPTLWNVKGLALGKLGKYKEALECFDKALKIDKKYASAWNNKGTALGMLGRYKEALECIDKVLKIDEKDVDAWFNKGIALGNLGKYKEAIECFDKVLKIDDKYVDAWNGKGLALGNLGKYDKEIECYNRALEIDKKYVHAWNNKSVALEKLGKHEDAKECYERAKQLT